MTPSIPPPATLDPPPVEPGDAALRRLFGLGDRPPQSVAAEPAYREHLRFHGRGSEYFRIWVVNLFLTLVTLGIYSAWAKVRKARWFAQHTSLAGDRFDYHGRPLRVLAGRLVALALLAAWTLAFDVSARAGLAVLALFCVIGPLLFASAQRFRLANTSWRGLRFGFDVPRREVYLVCVPVLLLWTAGTVLQALGVDGAWIGVSGLATVLVMPWAHARLKRLQHDHAHFGQQRFTFEPAGRAFYGLYLKAVLLVAVGAVAAVLVMLLWAQPWRGAQARHVDPASGVAAMVIGAVSALLMWLAAWPYFAARMQQIVWTHTRLGAEVRFAGAMKGARLWRLVVGQTLLTLLSLGLYWPFAAVALARYRVESIVVEAAAPIGEVAGALREEPRAAGDAAVDFFGLDLGW